MKDKYIPFKIMNPEEKGKVFDYLKDKYGIERLDGIILRKGEEKLFLFNGSMNEKEIKLIESNIIVERVGIYFAKIINDEIKLSLEGTNLLKNQIKDNIYEISDKETTEWMMGNDLDIKTGKREFLIIKNKEDFLGSGKASENKIGNFIPKTRRLKSKN